MKIFTLFFIMARLCFTETMSDTSTSATTIAESQAKPECNVLVAMKYSYFEKVVLKNIVDSLKVKGCSVTDIDIESFDNVDKSQYRAILLFSAVKSKGLIAPIRNYTDDMKKGANVFVCRVYGDLWEKGEKKKKSVDAISAATTSLQPSKVASQILSNLKF